MRALLDVNFLIALLDTQHVHHAPARQWLVRNIQHGWASCPLTQNGCVRIMAQQSYSNPVTACEAAALLRGAAHTEHHEFWSDDVSLLDEHIVEWRALLSSHQLTDVYLLALAVKRDGRLVTFDRNVQLAAVRGATPQHLIVI